MPTRDTHLLAVLIDADNVPAKYADAILNEVTSYGEPGLRRVYGDWSSQQLSGWTRTAQNLGLVQHQQTANTKGKNASDIGLVIDAMDILHAGHFDGFVLVSSDSDFTRLASRIREQGLTVIGIGEAKAPDALKNACNRFVAIENIYEDVTDAPRNAPPRPSSTAATSPMRGGSFSTRWKRSTATTSGIRWAASASRYRPTSRISTPAAMARKSSATSSRNSRYSRRNPARATSYWCAGWIERARCPRRTWGAWWSTPQTRCRIKIGCAAVW